MITVRRDGVFVKLSVDLAIPMYDVRCFTFNWNAGSEWAAGLLAEAIRIALRKELARIREQSYERGWKDAKSKTAKRKFFDIGWS